MKLNTGQVITVATGRLACSMGEVYEALNGLTGDELMTHQLPRANDFAEPHVKEACPWVVDIGEFPDLDEVSDKGAVVESWLAKISEEHGDSHEVPDLSGFWIHFDPLDEIVAIMAEDME